MESRADLTATDVLDLHLKREIELNAKMQIEKSGEKSKVEVRCFCK